MAEAEPSIALPADVVRRIFTAGDPPVLELEDRLRGEAVCKTWRAALAGLTLHSLELYGGAPEEKWLWAIQARPTVDEVQIYADPYGLATALLHSVSHEALRVLWLWSRELDVCSIVPCPAAFPNLRALYFRMETDDSDYWLQRLQQAPQLEQLQLHIEYSLPQWSIELPQMSQLTQLGVCAHVGLPVTIIPMDGLPALRELALHGGKALLRSDDPSASCCGAQLTRLVADVLWLELEGVKALPELRHLALSGEHVFETYSVLSTATALTRLELGSAPFERLNGWAAPLLRSAAALTSLKALVVYGGLTKAQAVSIGQLSQLRALAINAGCHTSLPPTRAPLWEALEAISWDVDCSSSLIGTDLRVPPVRAANPKVLRLHLRLKQLLPADVRALRGLQTLRHLWLSALGGGEAGQALAAAQSALPWLTSISLVAPRVDAFLEAAVGGGAD